MAFVHRIFRHELASKCFYATLRERVKKIDPEELYEPKFENPRVYPDYPPLDIRLQAYDFVPLEKFQSYIHKIAKRFDFAVEESFASAHKSERVKLFKPNTTTICDQIDLKLYNRWVRLSHVPTVHLPLFILLLQAHAPVGVKITIKEHESGDYAERYIPDLELKQLQEEYKQLDNPVVRRNLGWE